MKILTLKLTENPGQTTTMPSSRRSLATPETGVAVYVDGEYQPACYIDPDQRDWCELRQICLSSGISLDTYAAFVFNDVYYTEYSQDWPSFKSGDSIYLKEWKLQTDISSDGERAGELVRRASRLDGVEIWFDQPLRCGATPDGLPIAGHVEISLFDTIAVKQLAHIITTLYSPGSEDNFYKDLIDEMNVPNRCRLIIKEGHTCTITVSYFNLPVSN